MLLNKLIDTNAIALPWPVIIDGVVVPKNLLGSSEICEKKCAATPRCALDSTNSEEKICEFGLSTFSRRIGDHCVTVYGIRGPRNETKFNPYTKNGLKGRSVKTAEVESWFTALANLQKEIENAFISRQAEMLEPLHDPIRLARQVNSISNRLVQQSSHGQNFDDQVNNSPPELKSLVKASELLCDSFDLLAIYFNPTSATFGRKKAISIHGLVKKLVSVLRIPETNSTSTKRIHFNGECHRNIFIYDSFKLIPFALISNAVKYSLEGDVQVHIVDRNPLIEVSVESIGPLIEAEEIDLIFEKRARGKWAQKFSANGRGVGLFLAQSIAHAHGTHIRVTSRRMGRQLGEIPLANNRFWLEISPASLMISSDQTS